MSSVCVVGYGQVYVLRGTRVSMHVHRWSNAYTTSNAPVTTLSSSNRCSSCGPGSLFILLSW